MPRNRNAAKLAKNDTRFHWQCQGRTGGALVDEGGREASATEAAAYAYTYIGEENESVVWAAHIEVGLGMISDWP